MKKIPTLFKRDLETKLILPEVNPLCIWVMGGEGIATRKYDGTCVLIQNGGYFKRRSIPKKKPVSEDFIEVDFDEVTGKRFGWVPVTEKDKWHMEAFKPDLPDGTYELVGPKVQGNPERFEKHVLIRHADAERLENAPRTYEGLREYLKDLDIEGIVFHHPDGRMAKIKKRDFGWKR